MPEVKSDSATQPKRPLGLTDLPSSVRNNIYSHLLDTEQVNVGQQNVSYTHSIQDGSLRFQASRQPFPVETSLFYVNKAISKEALHYFYTVNLFVRFSIYTADARHAKTMLEESGVLFNPAAPEKIERCTQLAMDLTLKEKGSYQKRAVAMFPAQYLPRLINFMDQAGQASGSWGPNHILSMETPNTYGIEISRFQGDMLEIFRLLMNLSAVSIKGEGLLPGYAEELEASMTAKEFNPEDWMAMMNKMLARAIQVREKKDFKTAAQLCRAAIFSITYTCLTRAEAVHSQKDTFFRTIQRTRWRIESLQGLSLLDIHATTTSNPLWPTSSSLTPAQRQQIARDLLTAEEAMSHALSLATDSPSPDSNPWFNSIPPELIPPNKAEWFTDEERGNAWYENGLAHLALGENLFAAGDLERAERLLGKGNEKVAKAFGLARERIDWDVKPGSGMNRALRIARAGVD
jgi:hypothetical protein